MQKKLLSGVVAFVAVTLGGCSNGDFDDLEQYVAEQKSRPARQIAPLPTFRTYEAFSYNSAALRSPFEVPIKIKAMPQRAVSDVKPNFNRTKEHLEEFNIGALSMVGTIEKDQTLWALINDGDGGIYRIKIGNYMGKNHGRVVSISENQLDVIELVPHSENEWVERPRSLKLQVSEG